MEPLLDAEPCRGAEADRRGDPEIPSESSNPFAAEYDGLRRAARLILARKAWGENSLGPTDLVHEAAALLLNDLLLQEHRDPRYVFAAILRTMGRILLDRAAARSCIKRGGGWTRVPLDEVVDYAEGQGVAIQDLTGALEDLAKVEPRPAQVVMFRYFFLMNAREISRELGIAVSTVQADLAFGRAWLFRALGGPQG